MHFNPGDLVIVFDPSMPKVGYLIVHPTFDFKIGVKRGASLGWEPLGTFGMIISFVSRNQVAYAVFSDAVGWVWADNHTMKVVDV
jgi:hypothetical protein